MGGAAHQRDAVAHNYFQPVGHRPADQNEVLVVRRQVAALDDVLRQQSHRSLLLRLDAADEHGHRGLAAAGEAGRVDAARGGDHLWLGERRLHYCVGVGQRQQRQPLGLFPVAGRVHLKVPALQPHRVAVDGLSRPADEPIHKDQKHQTQCDGNQRDQGAPPVAPDVTPGHFQEFSHSFHLLLAHVSCLSPTRFG